MLIKVRCLLDVTITKRFNHVEDFLKQKFSVVLPVTDGTGLGHVHVLRLLVFFIVMETIHSLFLSNTFCVCCLISSSLL